MTSFTIPTLLDPTAVAAARQIIDRATRFVITTHMSPDGDAAGSALSIARYLTLKGKQATVVFNDQPGDNLSATPGVADALSYDKQNREAIAAIRKAEAFFCVDYNTLSRMGEMAKTVAENAAPKIMLDHHPDPDTADFAVVMSHPEMCATCEVAYHFIAESGDDAIIDKTLATTLYIGMMTDTGMFSYSCDRADIYLIIARLLATGFDKEQIHRDFSMEKERRLRLKGYLLDKKMKVLAQQGAAYYCLSKAEMKQYNHQKGDSEGFVNMPLAIPGVQVSAFFREEANFVKVSLRSTGNYPVNLIAEKFYNGGGHLNAAGGEFYGSLQQAELLFVKILPLFAKYLKS